MFNTIRCYIENRIKMAIAEEIVKIFRHDKQKEEREYTQEEKDKLQKMRDIKGNVPSPSPDPKRSHKIR